MTATEQTYSQTPVLSNDLVRLEPLDLKHQDDLAQAVLPGELWKTWYTRFPHPITSPTKSGTGSTCTRNIVWRRGRSSTPPAAEQSA